MTEPARVDAMEEIGLVTARIENAEREIIALIGRGADAGHVMTAVEWMIMLQRQRMRIYEHRGHSGEGSI